MFLKTKFGCFNKENLACEQQKFVQEASCFLFKSTNVKWVFILYVQQKFVQKCYWTKKTLLLNNYLFESKGFYLKYSWTNQTKYFWTKQICSNSKELFKSRILSVQKYLWTRKTVLLNKLLFKSKVLFV